MRKGVFAAFCIAVATMLGACDGGSVFGASADTGGNGGTPGGTPATSQIRLGSFSGANFVAGAISVSPISTLTAGGNTSLTVSLVDTANSNAPVTTAGSVNFTSTCLSQGDSSINSNPADLSTGTATVTYTYSGASCPSPDIITATVVAGGQTLTATANITVTVSPATSVQFISATPTNIGLQGSGRPDTSQVTFAVTNAAGGPVEGQVVNFSLDTSIGGITLSPATATGTTGANGQTSIAVRAGTVPTSVIVTARLVNNPSTTTVDESLIPPAQSSSLVISTGRPDQDSFSMSVGCFNIEGGDYDGVTTNVNIFASDRFNNPVPDGTPISFRAEGGTIQPNCFTTNGNCTLNFTSSNPRPADHRVTMLATAIGEESFVDANGDGRFDTGETFTDLADVIFDKNESGGATPDAGELIDFDGDGAFDAANGLFTGPLCDSNCDTQTSLYVRQSQIIIMSGSTASMTFSPSTFLDAGSDGQFEPAEGDFISLSPGNPIAVVAVAVGDSADQPMPAQTSIAASTTVGALVGDATVTQACTTFNGSPVYTFAIDTSSSTEDKTGVFTIKVTTPKGTVTTASIPVQFNAVEPPPPPPPSNTIGSIRFISASPSTIGIRGTGLPETSTVTFQVLTDTGGVFPDEVVNLSLSTTAGGIELNPTVATSDSSGFIRAVVRSGTIHTSVRVTATSTSLDSNGDPVTALSDSLAITTGIPDQDSFSLSLSCPNIEGGSVDGATVSVNLLAADRFNNPVTDGTAVSFEPEYGSMPGSCSTVGGACTVTWKSQEPRDNLGEPYLGSDGVTVCNPGPDSVCAYASPSFTGARPGRGTILATALGEESFIDTNGDGRFDTGEPTTDLGEAFRDDDGNGVYNSAYEEYLDFNFNGSRDAASGTFTGVLCDAGAGCDSATTLHVRGSVLVILSQSTPSINTGAGTADIICNGCAYDGATGTFSIGNNSLGIVSFVVRDSNLQPMPSGTTIAVTTPVADAGAFVGTTSYAVPCMPFDSAAANTRSFAFKSVDDAGNAKTSVVELKVTSPGGVVSTYAFSFVKAP
jgi:hypothetical protein